MEEEMRWWWWGVSRCGPGMIRTNQAGRAGGNLDPHGSSTTPAPVLLRFPYPWVFLLLLGTMVKEKRVDQRDGLLVLRAAKGEWSMP
jgi:hypothetical protein